MSTPTVTAAAAVAPCVARRSHARFTESASSPPTSPSRSMGSQAKNPTSATMNGESVSSRTSHARTINCIHLATMKRRPDAHKTL